MIRGRPRTTLNNKTLNSEIETHTSDSRRWLPPTLNNKTLNSEIETHLYRFYFRI